MNYKLSLTLLYIIIILLSCESEQNDKITKSSVLSSFEKNEAVTIRNPNEIRPWQHVLEPLGGYLALAEKLYTKGNKFSEGWNFGPKQEGAKTVEWIVEYMRKSWGNQPKFINDIKINPDRKSVV